MKTSPIPTRPFDEANVKRDGGGRFDQKVGTPADIALPVQPEFESPMDAKTFTEFRKRFHELPTAAEKVAVIEERWDSWSHTQREKNLNAVTNIASLIPNSPRVLDDIFVGEYGAKADAAFVGNTFSAAGARYKVLLSYRAMEPTDEEQADDRERVLHAAAWSLKSPRHKMVLDLLATDTDPRVRAAVALNRSTSPDTLSKLVEDPDMTVRRHALYNDSTPMEAKKKGALGYDVSEEDYTVLRDAFVERHTPIDDGI